MQVLAKESLTQSKRPDGIYKPITLITNMWAQISGHSSVQSSFTLGLRKARQPTCILRSKKIEQGQLLYPKICPPIFSKKLPSQVTRFPKGCTVQRSPIQSKLGFVFWSRKWSFQRPNQVSHAYKYGQASSYQVSRHSAQNCTVKWPFCPYSWL